MQSVLVMYNFIKYTKGKYKYVFANLLVILVFSFIYWYYGTHEHLIFNNDVSDTDNISYLTALYFTFTTHSTVGFGDITAKSRFMQSIIIMHLTVLVLNLTIFIL